MSDTTGYATRNVEPLSDEDAAELRELLDAIEDAA